MNLHQEKEFRDKLDYLIRKANEIQLQLAVLEKRVDAPAEVLNGRIRAKQAAAFLGVSPATFYQYLKQQPGFPVPIRMGPKCVFFEKSELQAWVESVKKTPKKVRAGKQRSQYA